jgi:hypothetical protein
LIIEAMMPSTPNQPDKEKKMSDKILLFGKDA